MKTQERQEDRGVREVGRGQPRSSVARDRPAFVYVVERTGKVSWGSQQDQLHGHATLSLRVLWTPALGLMLCFHAPEIHINFEERAPFVNLHCALQIMWPVLRLSPCRCPMAGCMSASMSTTQARWMVTT